MISTNYSLTRYDSSPNCVFDWKEPRYETDEEGNEVQQHLNVKTLFIGHTDTITNYVEVDSAGNITELTEPEFATEADYQQALAKLGVK